VEFRHPYPLPPEQKKQRAPEDIIRDHSEEVSDLNITWRKPSAQLKELLSAAKGSSVARRSNACGALKVLTLKKKTLYHLARTNGLLGALIYAASECPCHVEDEAALDARNRAMAALINLSDLKENRFIILHHDGLIDCLLKVIIEDSSESRMLACRLFAVLAKTVKNRDSIVQNEHIVITLSCVLRGKCKENGLIIRSVSSDGVLTGSEPPHSDSEACTDLVEYKGTKSGAESYLTDEESSWNDQRNSTPRTLKDAYNIGSIRQKHDKKFDEYLNVSRLSSCAALSHLSKHCTAVAVLCKYREFLEHLWQYAWNLTTNFTQGVWKYCVILHDFLQTIPYLHRTLLLLTHLLLVGNPR